MKKYNIIYADFPWRYNNRRVIRKDGKKPRFGVGAINKYECMSIEEAKKFPIKKLAAENCALFLWTTMPQLDQQIKLIENFGFRYSTLGIDWIKTIKKGTKAYKYYLSVKDQITKDNFIHYMTAIANMITFFGIGHYTKSNSELLLLGIKGRMEVKSNKIKNVLLSPKREHSRKPDEIRDRIVELFGDLPRIELFARCAAPGWARHGLEKDKFTDVD